MNVNSAIDERAQREIYLPIFEAAVKEAKVGAIMDSYNLVNGEHMTKTARSTLTSPRRTGDSAASSCPTGAAHDAGAAANGGLDLEMPSGQFMNRANLLSALQSGKVSVATIDDKVRRIVRTATEFGFLDRNQSEPGIPCYSEEDREVALQGAEEAVVLLKNDGSLAAIGQDEDQDGRRVGSQCLSAVPVGGGSAGVEPFHAISYLEGIGDFLGVNGKVLYSRGIISSEEACERTRFTVDEKGTAPGLRGEYFTNPDFAGIPEVRTDAHVDFEWSGGPIGSNDGAGRSVRWTAYFTPNKTGRYRWLVNADASDAYRLFMGGKLAGECKAWSDRPAGAELTMEAGKAQAVKLEIMVGHAFVPHVIGLGAIVPGDMVTPEAKQLAALADAVVVCVGFNPGTESEGATGPSVLFLGRTSWCKRLGQPTREQSLCSRPVAPSMPRPGSTAFRLFCTPSIRARSADARCQRFCSASSIPREGCPSAGNAAGKIIPCTTVTM